MSKATTFLHRDSKRFNIFDFLESEETANLPVKFSTPESSGNLPVCLAGHGNLPGKRTEVKPFPMGIQDVELKDNRAVKINGKTYEIPFGAKEKLTAGAIKTLIGAYPGHLVMLKKGSGSVRMDDEEIIELPKNGTKLELTIIVSFRTE
jgi:hypothetical protein